MADIVRAQNEQIPPVMQSRWVDLEDGTHALLVAAVIVGAGEPGAAPTALLIDEITGASVSIPVIHHEVHEGETFQTSYKTLDGTPLVDNANLVFLLRTGVRYCHLVWQAAAGGDAEVRLYEDTTFSAAGAALNEWNMKRTSANIATMTATLDPTITTIGTLLHNCFWPGGTGGNSPGGTARADTEWILIPNSTYALQLTNRAGLAQPASLVAQWYEEETD